MIFKTSDKPFSEIDARNLQIGAALDLKRLSGGSSETIQSIVDRILLCEIGQPKLWHGDTPPAHHLECDGSTINVADYPALALVLGYKFGFGGTLTKFHPNMTSNTAPSGYVASAHSGSAGAYLQFNGADDTLVSLSSTQWYKLQLPAAVTAKWCRVYITTATASFKIQGSNNDSTWTDLLNVANYATPFDSTPACSRYFKLTTTGSYLYYRIYATATMEMKQLSLYDTDPSTFALPDMRGLFVRGYNHGRAAGLYDPSAALRKNVYGVLGDEIGSLQQDQFQGHFHIPRDPDGDQVYVRAALQDLNAGGTSSKRWIEGTTYVSVQEATTDGTNGTPRKGNETRPSNLSCMFIMRYEW